MIADLKPYPEYRNSGVSWIGQVPINWSVTRIKTVLRELDHRSKDGSGILLSLTRKRGLIPHKEMTDKLHSAKTLVGYKQYRPGQIVMNRMQAWSGMFGTGPIEGLVSPDYAVFDVLEDHKTSLLLECLKCPNMVGQFAIESKGIGSGFNRLYTDRFGQIPIALPPLDEQTAIVHFINHTNHRIESTIRAKRNIILLLNEQMQVIIHRAVTRGIDPKVRLKPSGIPWIGDIPENWETLRCGHLFHEVNETGYANLQLLSIDRFKGIIPQSDTGRKERASKDRSKYKRVQRGELAYNLMNAFMGSIAVSNHDGIVSPAYAVAKPTRHMNPHYYHHLLRTNLYTGEYSRRSYGIMYERNRLYFERFKLVTALVPPIQEQHDIVEWIKENTASITITMARIEREIDLLREYQTSLVSDVVTGKLDVREAAAQLPDEGEKFESNESLSEVDDIIEDEEL